MSTNPTKFTNVESEEGFEVGGKKVVTGVQPTVAELEGEDSTTGELHDKVNELIGALQSTGTIE